MVVFAEHEFHVLEGGLHVLHMPGDAEALEPPTRILATLVPCAFALPRDPMMGNVMDASTHRESFSDTPRTAGWLGINSSCRYLDCSRAHLYSEIKAGKIPTRRLGSRIRIRITDLDACLERESAP
jgi:excisionase family DNA binding protein